MKLDSESPRYGRKIFNFYIKTVNDISAAIKNISDHSNDIAEIKLHNQDIQLPLPIELTEQLLIALNAAPNLKTLRIEKFKFYFGMGMLILLRRISRLRNLTTLSLEETYIGEAGCHTLTAGLIKNSMLKKLELIDVALVPYCSYEKIASLLENNNHITFLDISHNAIWPSNCKRLLKTLKARKEPRLKLIFDIAPSWVSNQQLHIERLSQINQDQTVLKYLAAARKGLMDYNNDATLRRSLEHSYQGILDEHKNLMAFTRKQQQFIASNYPSFFVVQGQNEADRISDEMIPLLNETTVIKFGTFF